MPRFRMMSDEEGERLYGGKITIGPAYGLLRSEKSSSPDTAPAPKGAMPVASPPQESGSAAKPAAEDPAGVKSPRLARRARSKQKRPRKT